MVIRRIVTDHPGELVHVDVKKRGRIPTGGGWRVLGREGTGHKTTRVGYDFVHSAIDATLHVAGCVGSSLRCLDRESNALDRHRTLTYDIMEK